MPQPYQMIFPLALAYGFWGALLWILFALGLTPYPGALHAHLMVCGFLMTAAMGFLLTAVPRFMGSSVCTRVEGAIAVVLASLLVLSAVSSNFFFLVGTTVGSLIFMNYFFHTRYFTREYQPPPSFALVGVGLFVGLMGSILMLGSVKGLWPSRLGALGKIYLYHGTMLFFILGIGIRLITNLLGWGRTSVAVQLGKFGSLPSKAPEGATAISGGKISSRIQKKIAMRIAPYILPVQGVLLVASFLLEIPEQSVWAHAAHILRATVVTWIAMDSWKLYRRPKLRGRLTYWLWVGCWCLVSGLWIFALFPSLGIHGLHIAFISGFGLMTLMVATRVTLAHGDYELELEYRSKAIRWAGLLIVLAAVSRATAQVVPMSYVAHLGYAAGLWIVGLIVWVFVFGPKIIFVNRPRSS